MSLQLILGNSGSGKSYHAYQKIIQESLAHPERNFLVIVPEQFTMQIQKELVNMHPNKGILNIDILSFERLAFRVFEEVGADSRSILEETGKSLLLRKVAIEHQDEMQMLGNNLKKRGYITEIKSVISELTQYNVSMKQLDGMIEFAKGRPQLYYKLQDVKVLYEAFREKLEKTYITTEEILGVLCEVLPYSERVKDSVIVLDGFTGFTPLQQRLLGELLRHCRQMLATVTIDARENPWAYADIHQLFYLSKQTIHTLLEIAKQSGTLVDEPVTLGARGVIRFQNTPALGFLEQHFMRHDKIIYPQEQREISIHVAKNAVEEIHFAARTIISLIQKSGYRYQDIAVITGDMASYGNYIRQLFEQYEIPVFIDETKTILLNPFIEFIRAALEILTRDYSYESVFRYLRTGMCGLAKEEIDRLENYVLAVGIRGFSGWKKKWEHHTRKISAEEVASCNEMREKIMASLLPFSVTMKEKKATVKEKTKALYELISIHGIQTQLAVYEEQFKAANRLDMAKEYGQIYGIIIGLLDKMVAVLGAEVLSLKEYTEVLEAGFEEAKVGIIPPTADRIVVGDMERTRLKEIRALIFVGLNDQWVPRASNKAEILSQMDREMLLDFGVALAPTARENSYIQRFYLYLNLTKPSERLYLSYSKSGTDGGAMRPSYIVTQIKKMFAGLAVIDEDRYTNAITRIASAKSGIPYLIEGMRSLKTQMPATAWQELYSWYLRTADWKPKMAELVEAAFVFHLESSLGREVARRLYGSVLENSVSRLECFAACACSHFLKYGLQVSPREEFSFQPVDMGNVFHRVIEVFSQQVEQSTYTWFDIPDAVRDAMATACVQEVTAEYGAQILHSSARNAYMIERMQRIMRRTVWALCEQVKAGNFVPGNYEVSFSMVEDLEAVNIVLSEEEKMKLRGRIDRVDICEEKEQVYVKVIDYKSGNTEFDMVALYHGLQLQLVVYLNAAMELEKRIHPEKEIVPAGIFYYRMQDPVLERENGINQTEINEKILKKLKLNGLVNQAPEAIQNMDRNLVKDSHMIPVSYNKDGSVSRYSSIATGEQFRQLSDFVNEKMRTLGSRILAGETTPLPYERGGRTACDYCEYCEVCGFDTKIPGTHYRRLAEFKTAEVWRKMDEEV